MISQYFIRSPRFSLLGGFPKRSSARDDGAIVVDGVVSSMTQWCNNRNVLHLRFADFQRVIDSANSQNVLAGMNVIKA
jgi:hypothetical protein